MDWKVAKERIEIAPHYNADALEVARVGDYQLVVQKGIYNTGDEVIFIPEKSILPDPIAEGFRDYLVGTEKNRVKAVRLRGEFSCGVVISVEAAKEHVVQLVYGGDPTEEELEFWGSLPYIAAERIDRAAYGEDVSNLLHISKYEPPIPASLSGQVKAIDGANHWTSHDCYHFASQMDEFEDGEQVFVTEKVHGSQAIYYRNADGDRIVTSKGISKRGLRIEESDENTYWQATRNMGIFEYLDENYPDQDVQLFGEVVPVQGGYNYGFTQPHVLFYRVLVDGQELPHSELNDWFYKNWVPVIHFGELDKSTVRDFAKGMETVSGKQRHIREGVVVSPCVPRRDRRGRPLYSKIINPKYKETGDELN